MPRRVRLNDQPVMPAPNTYGYVPSAVRAQRPPVIVNPVPPGPRRAAVPMPPGVPQPARRPGLSAVVAPTPLTAYAPKPPGPRSARIPKSMRPY